VKSSFEQSFEKINHNLLWFNTYADDVSRWALQNKREEEKERSTAKQQESTTVEPSTDVSRSSTPSAQVTTPKPSSAPSDVYNGHIIVLRLVVVTSIVKTYVL